MAGVRAARRLAWSLWLLTVVLLMLGAWLEALNRIADHTCSATTLCRRRDEWITAGVADQL